MISSCEIRCDSRLRRQSLGRYRYARLRWRIVFTLVDWLGGVAWRAGRTLRRWLRPGSGEEPVDPRAFQATRILLVQLDHLGDGVLSLGMLPLLRRRWPEAEIEVLASPANQAVFEAAPEVDRVHVAAVNRFARCVRRRWGWLVALFVWGWRLRRRGVDLAIDVRGEFPLALLCWLTGARLRVGWSCGGGGFLLTHSAAYVPGRPEVASRLALLDELGIRPAPGESGVPRFAPAPAARIRMAERLGASDRPLVVMHVGAGMPAKRWPARHWQTYSAAFVARNAAQVVLVGGAAERPLAAKIVGGLGNAVADWTGQLSLDELAALLERADVFVGADSGPAHLAAAVGTPVVALFSGTNQPAQWQPRGSRVVVVRQPVACGPCHRQRCACGDHPCMSGLEPATVLTATEWMLRSGRRWSASLERPTETFAGKGAKS
jgi:lipopolysaccharide heptosyltransferase II